MYRVAICDDDAAFRARLAGLVKQILTGMAIQAHELEVYASCDELEAALDGKPGPNLLFLDILMDGKNGMEFAKDLRRFDEKCTIVFITVTEDYIHEGYDVAARQYIGKPFDPEKIRALLEEDYEKKFRPAHIAIRKGKKRFDLPVDQVYSVENERRRCVYHMEGGEEVGTVRECEFDDMGGVLPPGFLRCHRKFYVNLSRATGIDDDAFLMPDGSRVPISRRMYTEVHRAYMALAERRRFT